jgi:membrane protein DedA with SNARE-associated domain
MYTFLLIFHSLFRWAVLISLIWAIVKAFSGYSGKKSYTKADNALRHWTATIAHVQLLLGITLFTQSPTAKMSAKVFTDNGHIREPFFFGVIHLSMMILAVIIVTIGSAIAKRKEPDSEKFKTMLIWFGIALIIILIAIPWPFSPLAQRPYIRS